ncbi:MAG: zinc ribbon domain-containing protein [Clostridia bacterium]|nr:zinc ribbon domain-containing protein [Clostridia bacterium]
MNQYRTDHQVICTSCGTTILSKQKFCHICGSRCTPPKSANLCNVCGTELLPQAVFCAECGASVYATESAPSQAPVPIADPTPVSAAESQPAPQPAPQPVSAPTCASCGTQLGEGQHFCRICGTEYAPVRKRFCNHCGNSLPPNVSFCTACGTLIQPELPSALPVPPASSTPFPAPAPSQARIPSKPRIVELIKKSAVLALSVLLLLSLFFPVLKDEIKIYGSKSITLDYNILDSAIFFVDSFDSVARDDIGNTELAEKLTADYEELADQYEDDWKDGDEYDKMNPILKGYVRLLLRSEMVDPTVNMGICFALCLLYTALVICIAVFAVLSFISAFKPSVKDRLTRCVHLIALIPGAVCALVMAFKVSGYAFELKRLFGTANIERSVGGWMTCAIVASLLVVIAFAVIRLIGARRGGINIPELVKRLCVCTLSGVLILLSCSPIFSLTAETVFQSYRDDSEASRATSTADASLFSQLITSEYARNTFEKEERSEKFATIEYYFGFLSYYTKGQFENNRAYTYEVDIIQYSVLSFGGYEYSWAFGLGSTAVILLIVMAAILLWKNLFALAEGAPAKKRWTIPAKALAIFAAVIVVALIFVIGALVASNSKVEFYVAPHLNAYFMLAVSVVLACIPMGKKKPSDAGAYAPYSASPVPFNG